MSYHPVPIVGPVVVLPSHLVGLLPLRPDQRRLDPQRQVEDRSDEVPQLRGRERVRELRLINICGSICVERRGSQLFFWDRDPL